MSVLLLLSDAPATTVVVGTAASTATATAPAVALSPIIDAQAAVDRRNATTAGNG